MKQHRLSPPITFVLTVILINLITITSVNASLPEYNWHLFTNGATPSAQAIDANGNILIVGIATNSWLGNNNESPTHAYSEAGSVWLLKLDQNGNYLWHTFFGDNSTVSGHHFLSLDTDTAGNIYVAGNVSQFSDWNGPNNELPLEAFHGGNVDGYLAKIDVTGEYQWHRFIGPNGASTHEATHSVAVDSSGDIYTANSDLLGAFFVSKFNSVGADLWQFTYGEASQFGQGQIHIDSNDAIFIVHHSTFSTLFNGPNGELPLHSLSVSNDRGFHILKLDKDANYQWHTFHGGQVDDNGVNSGDDVQLVMSSTSNGDLYVAGGAEGSWLENSTAPTNAYKGSGDIFVTKFDSQGSYQWHTFWGSHQTEGGPSLAFDDEENILISAYTLTNWLGPNNEQPLAPLLEQSGGVVLAMDSDSTYLWHTFLNGSIRTISNDVNSLYVVGDGRYGTQHLETNLLGTDTTLPLSGLTPNEGLYILKYDFGNFVPDDVPDAFGFTSLTNVELNSIALSQMITISGINVAAEISITGGEYILDTGQFTDTTGSISNGQTIRIRTTASAAFDTTQSVVLTIGGVSATFDVTTKANASSGSNSGNGGSGGGSISILTLLLLIYLLAVKHFHRLPS